METIEISDALRAKAEQWLMTEGVKVLANKKKSPVRNLPPKKEFNYCEAQHLQAGDRIKFGRYVNGKTWVVQEVKKDVYPSISPCVDYVIVTCRDPRKKSISQFSLPAERLIMRESKL